MKNIIILLCLSFLALSADKILDKQLEILDLMQNDNIEDIDIRYYKLLYNKNSAMSEKFLIKAADDLDKEALLILGFKFLQSDRVEESLILLCQVSILGNKSVARDLYLMPMLLNITRNDVESACGVASLNMKNLLNKKQKDIKYFKSVQNKINGFEYDRASKELSYVEYLNFLSYEINSISDSAYDQFFNDSQNENIQMKKKNKRLDKERLERKNADWNAKAYLQRVQGRKDGASTLLELNRDADVSLIKDDISEKLNYFNELRSDKKKLTSENFWKLVYESKQ